MRTPHEQVKTKTFAHLPAFLGQNESQEKISIILTNHTESAYLKECLESILAQNYTEKFELIFVDSEYTDAAKEIVINFFKKNCVKIDGKYIRAGQPKYASLRNAGVKKASGAYLFFTDSDCIVPHDWVSKILAAFTKYPEASVVGGRSTTTQNAYEKVFNRTDTLMGVSDNFECISYSSYKQNPCGYTKNICYKKEIFTVIGLFDTWTDISSRIDWEFKLRAHYAGFTLVYTPIVIESKKKTNLWGFLHNGFRTGQTDYYLSTRFKNYNTTIHLGSLFYSLDAIRRRFPHDNLCADFLFLSMRFIGAKIRKLKSQVLYSQTESETVVFRQKNIGTELEEICTYVSRDFYYYSENSINRRAMALHLLNKVYNTPLISIIIPFFNRADYINNHLIQSLNGLSGSDSSVELIFINDGSSDNTLDRLEQSKKKLRFSTRILTQVNKGPASARNLGLKNAQGTYIFMTDSDVIVPKYWLMEFLAAFLYDVNIVLVGGGQTHKNPLSLYDHWRNSSAEINQQIFFTNSHFIEHRLPYDTANMAIKNGCGFSFDENFVFAYEDFDFVYNIKKQNQMVCYLPIFVSNMRHMNYGDFNTHITNRTIGFKMFQKKIKDYRFNITFYYLFGMLFSERNDMLKILNLKKILELLK